MGNIFTKYAKTLLVNCLFQAIFYFLELQQSLHRGQAVDVRRFQQGSYFIKGLAMGIEDG